MAREAGRRIGRLARALSGVAGILAAILAPAIPRAATLADLGYVHGLTMRGPHPSAEVFFPLPNDAGDADLAIDLVPSVALDPYSSLTVFVDDEPLATLPTREGARTVHVTIPRRLTTADFARVRFVSDQALRRDAQCFDVENPAVWTHIAPGTQLTAPGGQPGIGSVWRELGGEVPIAIPAEPTVDDIETALVLSVALLARGAQPTIVGPDDARALIRVGPNAVPLAVEAAGPTRVALASPPLGTGMFGPPPPPGLMPEPAPIVAAPHPPRLLVTNPGAARALVVAAPALRGLASAQAAAEPRRDPPATGLDIDSLSLAQIGLHPAPIDVFSTAAVTMELPFNRLPVGRHPVAFQLFGRAAAPPLEEALVVTVSADARLLWSQTFRGTVDLDGVRIDLPDGIARNRMPVSVKIVRVGTRRVCGADDALGFDLRETSRIMLADGYVQPRTFADFAFPGDRSALVRLDVPPASAASAIPLLARLLTDAGARPASIAVAGAGARIDRPFIVVADVPPPELGDSAPARPDLGRVVLERPGEGVRVELSGVTRLTTVQIAAAGVIPGLWVSLGAPPALGVPASLASGDVAVFDGVSARAIVFDTRVPGAIVERPKVSVADGLLTRWRGELFIVAWLAITLLAALVVLRMRRSRTPAP